MSTVATPHRVPVETLRRSAPTKLDAPASRPAVRLLTFSALGLYGALRWATLVAPAATGRMLLLLVLAVATGGLLGARAQRGGRNRLLAAAAVIVPVIAVFPLCGVPLTMVTHLRVAVVAHGIGQGLTALPRVIVPYAGVNSWARTVILLGGGLLVLDAGILLAFVPHAMGDARRAAAALPLIALAIVPAALEAPRVSYLQGLLLFVLVAAFVWGERLGRREVLPALAIAGVTGVAGVILAPGLDTHRPVLNYQSIANSFSPSGTETFDWFQGYGPYSWPTSGTQVLSVKASRPEFWKTENLDQFDGTGWAQAAGNAGASGNAPPATPPPSAAALATWTQSLRVTIGVMYTTEIVASGTAQRPENVTGGVVPGPSPGTWTANQQLGPGDAYLVKVYAPNPTRSELAAARGSYPADLSYYRQMFVPELGAGNVPGTVVFPAFGSTAPSASAGYVGSTMAASPYAAAYRLARRLGAGARTPDAYIERVYRYLQHGYRYDTNAPRSPYPLATFLFAAKYGYCQQFAGAMALLLRMGGVPARVAVGFTPGSYDSSISEWSVADFQAHAWVEVWFPSYGWVAFNPTPATSTRSAAATAPAASRLRARPLPSKVHGAAHDATTTTRRRGGGTVSLAALLAIILVALGIGGGGLASHRRRRRREPPSSDELLVELERALRRSSFTLTPATTLADLEHRFRRSEEAAEYVRTVGRARYADGEQSPTRAQRRAFRAQLAVGRGTIGRLRALWALPPRL
ncbi:MAG TPA: transglutaminase-like domain-containing protein [Solirubrobacteraceae bacterium]|nr:transglutaminase-like domain-containing protein [Solirubrobacteraceae bacterium]